MNERLSTLSYKNDEMRGVLSMNASGIREVALKVR